MQNNNSRNLKSVGAHFMTYATASNLDRSGDVANLSHRNSELHTFNNSLVGSFTDVVGIKRKGERSISVYQRTYQNFSFSYPHLPV